MVIPDGVRQRFWDHVQLGPGCWEWQGSTNSKGYARFSWPGRRYISGHRAAYLLEVGPIPRGKEVCHRCDNRRCVRPDHLFLGDHVANMADAAQKRRMRHGSDHHRAKLTWDDVRAMREAYAGGTPGTELAARFNLNRSTAYKILRGVTWFDSTYEPRLLRGDGAPALRDQWRTLDQHHGGR